MSIIKSISCANCNWRFFLGAAEPPAECPNCRSRSLSEVESEAPYEPELHLPFSVEPDEFATRVKAFSDRIPYPPHDLAPGDLIRRSQRIFLPQYLVDATVEGRWQAEMGFDYQVVSHQEQLAGSGWQSVERKETRVRWEPRVGSLSREYHNIRAPALEGEHGLVRSLGPYSMAGAQPARSLEPGAFIRLPDRDTTDAWSDAVPGFLASGMEECRLAASADHVRAFSWDAAYTNQHWTQLLMPVFTTYYLDDDGRAHRLLMHGQTGALSGTQRASMKRARGVSLRILVAAIVVFVLGIVGLLFGAVFAPALVLGAGALGAAFAVGVGAVVPVFRVWRFNRNRQ